MMRTINLQVPTKWEELTNDQLKFVARLFNSEWSAIKYKFLTHALIRFAGLKILKSKPIRGGFKTKYAVKKKGERAFALSSDQVHSAASKLEWILKSVQEVKPLRSILFTKPCSPRMYNTRFAQFLTAENFCIAYEQTKKREHLNCLVATIYHFPWQRFDEDKVKRRSLKYRMLPVHVVYTVYLWYSGFRWYVARECPHIFSDAEGGGTVKIKEHIMGMIRLLTEGDVIKNDQVQKVSTWDALYELDAKAKSAKELKRRMDEIKSKTKR